ncbi:hypothetical protein BC834DRAFT_924948 [Gloeopeniophorella convolvens]|nr:hypothetical protein BC834DRAFT_924948 [Gloeopeniophorella convolvens]
MDPSLQPTAPQNTLPTMTAASSGKRSRENESPSQRHKREKAAERQRRKRERDRNASLQNGLVNLVAQQQAQQQQAPQHPPPVIAAVAHPQQALAPAPPPPGLVAPGPDAFVGGGGGELSAAELSRRERVRTAARERQRKHRALMKQKKLRELGLDMGNELGVQGLEDMPYRLPDGTPNPFGAPPLQHDLAQAPPPPLGDAPFPPGHHGGQTFASTLLLSFSCAPLLKQHILRTLSMTNEELASLEPIIAQAWDQWDHQRRMHYAQQAQVAAAGGKPPDAHAHTLGDAPPPPPPPPGAFELGDAAGGGSGGAGPFGGPEPPGQSPASDFRARFHRSLVAPSPFRSFAPPTPADGIDPQLDAVEVAKTPAGAAAPAIDPELGQARGEAEGVVGRLERGPNGAG